MDETRFDTLARSFTETPSRRSALGLLASSALGGLLTLGTISTEAKKKKKKKRKKSATTVPPTTLGPVSPPPCVRDCTDKLCGDDGCGGSCGPCEGGTCPSGQCECPLGKKHCEGTCIPDTHCCPADDNCPSGKVCNGAGTCVRPCPTGDECPSGCLCAQGPFTQVCYASSDFTNICTHQPCNSTRDCETGYGCLSTQCNDQPVNRCVRLCTA
jgi:hypothetical protein